MKKIAKKDIYKTKIQPRQGRLGLVGSVVTGFAALLAISGSSNITNFTKGMSATNSLRGDFVRLGGDMRSAIAKERKRSKTNS